MQNKNSHIYVYPAIFSPEPEGGYYVHFPDIDNCFTCGDTLEEGMLMAKEVLSLMIFTNYEETITEVPSKTPLNELKLQKNEFATYVICDTSLCRRKFSTRKVKRTLTIPEWLSYAADEAKIDISQVLQEALIERLNREV